MTSDIIISPPLTDNAIGFHLDQEPGAFWHSELISIVHAEPSDVSMSQYLI